MTHLPEKPCVIESADTKADPSLALIPVKNLVLFFTEISALDKLTCLRFSQKNLSDLKNPKIQ